MSMYYIGDFAFDGMYLEHHGILGQKWGVRRYQYRDGSLTPVGYAHYGYGHRENVKKTFVKNLSGAYEKEGNSRRNSKRMAKEEWKRQNEYLYRMKKDIDKLEKERDDKLSDIEFEATENLDDGILDKYFDKVVKDYREKHGNDGNSDADIMGTYFEDAMDMYLDDYASTQLTDISDKLTAIDSNIRNHVDKMMRDYVDTDADTIAARMKAERESRENYESEKAKSEAQFEKDINEKVDWDKKDKTFSDLQKTWKSLLEYRDANSGSPDLDSERHPFRKKMYELSGNPDRPKNGNGFNFKQAAKAVEKLRKQFEAKEKNLKGDDWMKEWNSFNKKEDQIFAEAIAKDLGYTPTKETVNFFEQIMYSD